MGRPLTVRRVPSSGPMLKGLVQTLNLSSHLSTHTALTSQSPQIPQPSQKLVLQAILGAEAELDDAELKRLVGHR